MELLPPLPTDTGDGAEMAPISKNAELAMMLGEGLELAPSGDISCFRQMGRGCRASEVESCM